ncbi:MAG: hypothetical protein Q7J57_07125 [Gemmobacter sp.]|nr:hypothetical protein [Gemmobacter sp.]
MELIADMLLAAGAFGVAVYCFVLSRRLTRFTQLETGMGGAIAVLSAQVDDMTRALIKAQAAAGDSTAELAVLTVRGEAAAARLELLVASLHDLPDSTEPLETQGQDLADRRMRFVRRRPARGEEAAE